MSEPPRRHPRRLASPTAGRSTATRPAKSAAATDAAKAGVAGIVPETTRSGEDVRRRGWFWHWNSIVTQYAPLVGLKGVGLLNSYTVWTDRREESPHRGYAFPSQQREADFYGEDRAELITINKILVALDLIEIRKEMVLRPDEQGRKWRVPHNFYRVKDHADGFSLTSRDVLKVVALAEHDKAVYRYIRRIFSPRFAPIDPDNVWNRMLPELRAQAAWQRLAARAAREDDRASARTLAGHAARRGNLRVPSAGDSATPSNNTNDSDSGETDSDDKTSGATSNNGLPVAVGQSNDGSPSQAPTVVGRSNDARPTAVAPANTMYHQSDLTTTTTPARTQNENPTMDAGPAVIGLGMQIRQPAPPEAVRPISTGPAGQAAPADAPGETAALQAYADANARPPTPAERHLLRDLAERFEPAARAAAAGEAASGWTWLTAAIYEAVAAGSAYVAPRRLREILGRWEREGRPASDSGAPEPVRGRPMLAPPDGSERREAPTGPVSGFAEARTVRPASNDLARLLGEGPDITLPHGFGSRQTWTFTVSLLANAIDRRRLRSLIEGTAIVGYQDGEITVACPTPAQAARLAGEYRELIERKLGEAMRQPIRLQVPGEPSSAPAPEALEGNRAERPPDFLVPECGLPSGPVWAAVLQELRQSREIDQTNFETWLRATTLLGRHPDSGTLIVGVPHSLAGRRLRGRLLRPVQTAVATVIGTPLAIEFVVTSEWLRESRAAPDAHQSGTSGG